MNFNQRVLAPLPTSLHQMTNCVALDDQLKISDVVDDDNCNHDLACPPCSEAVKENISVTFANLFEFDRNVCEVVINESLPYGSTYCECDQTLRQSTFDCEGVATSSSKASNKRAVSFAPSCQVLHVGNDDNQAYYLCHEAVKEGSPRVCFDGETGHILGLKKRRSPQAQGSFDSDAATCEMSKKLTVSFAPSCPTIHLIDNQTEGIEDELWYSQNDFMYFEDEACLCSQMIRDSESQGIIFDVELEHILGLEKIILSDTYFDRRDALRQTILNEQAVQQLVKDLRSRQGCGSDGDVSHAEDASLVHLANTSERLSLWARERASMAAFTLEHDLTTTTCEARP